MNNTKQRVLFAKGKSNNLTEREGLLEKTAAARTLVRNESAQPQKNDQSHEAEFQQKNPAQSVTNSAVRSPFSNKTEARTSPSEPAGTAAPAGNSM